MLTISITFLIPIAICCKHNSECQDRYCEHPQGNCDLIGRCSETPIMCTMTYEPVCSCKGKTYSNECWARLNNMSIAYNGTCKNDTVCSSNLDCITEDGTKRFCNFESKCTGKGQCSIVPDVCAETFDPVCGCNKKTYPNSCTAAMHGVSTYATIRSGECKMRKHSSH